MEDSNQKNNCGKEIAKITQVVLSSFIDTWLTTCNCNCIQCDKPLSVAAISIIIMNCTFHSLINFVTDPPSYLLYKSLHVGDNIIVCRLKIAPPIIVGAWPMAMAAY